MKIQGWFNLFKEPCQDSIKLVQQFYKFLKTNKPTVEYTASTSCHFYWSEEDLTITVQDLASIYGLTTGSHLLRIHHQRNWAPGSTNVIEGVFGSPPSEDEKKKRKYPRYVFEILVFMRIIHSFIVTMIQRRPDYWDCVTCFDVEILYEVINGRLVDTPQLLLYALQCSINNTQAPMVVPHLVKPILDHLGLESTMEDPVTLGKIFQPQDLKRVILHSNLAYVTPPPYPEKPLRLTAPPSSSKKKPTPDLPQTSAGSCLGLRNGDSIEIIKKMGILNESVAAMRSDLGTVVELLKKIVHIFVKSMPFVARSKDDPFTKKKDPIISLTKKNEEVKEDLEPEKEAVAEDPTKRE